jgi:hypothetical protein
MIGIEPGNIGIFMEMQNIGQIQLHVVWRFNEEGQIGRAVDG